MKTGNFLMGSALLVLALAGCSKDQNTTQANPAFQLTHEHKDEGPYPHKTVQWYYDHMKPETLDELKWCGGQFQSYDMQSCQDAETAQVRFGAEEFQRQADAGRKAMKQGR